MSGVGWAVRREWGKGYAGTSSGQEDSFWCWMPGLRGKQHHVLLFTSHHSTVIASSDLLVSAQNKRMDLSLNCAHNKGVCFIGASQGSGASKLLIWENPRLSYLRHAQKRTAFCFKPRWLTVFFATLPWRQRPQQCCLCVDTAAAPLHFPHRAN